MAIDTNYHITQLVIHALRQCHPVMQVSDPDSAPTAVVGDDIATFRGDAIADSLEEGYLAIRPGNDERDALVEDLLVAIEDEVGGNLPAVIERARSHGYGKASVS